MIDDHLKLRLAPGVTVQSLPGQAGDEAEGVIVALEDGQFYSCNQTTLDFLMAIDGTRSLADITTLLHGRYDVELEELRGDLRAVLRQLVQDKLVVPSEG